jgi:hypothetical protein
MAPQVQTVAPRVCCSTGAKSDQFAGSEVETRAVYFRNQLWNPPSPPEVDETLNLPVPLVLRLLGQAKPEVPVFGSPTGASKSIVGLDRATLVSAPIATDKRSW